MNSESTKEQREKRLHEIFNQVKELQTEVNELNGPDIDGAFVFLMKTPLGPDDGAITTFCSGFDNETTALMGIACVLHDLRPTQVITSHAKYQGIKAKRIN